MPGKAIVDATPLPFDTADLIRASAALRVRVTQTIATAHAARARASTAAHRLEEIRRDARGRLSTSVRATESCRVAMLGLHVFASAAAGPPDAGELVFPHLASCAKRRTARAARPGC